MQTFGRANQEGSWRYPMLRRGRASDRWFGSAQLYRELAITRAEFLAIWLHQRLPAQFQPCEFHVYLQHHGAMTHRAWLPGGYLCQMQGTKSSRKLGHCKDPEQVHGAKREVSRQQRQLSHSAKGEDSCTRRGRVVAHEERALLSGVTHSGRLSKIRSVSPETPAVLMRLDSASR